MRRRTEAVYDLLRNIARMLHLRSRIVAVERLSVDHGWVARAAAADKKRQIQFARGRVSFALLRTGIEYPIFEGMTQPAEVVGPSFTKRGATANNVCTSQ